MGANPSGTQVGDLYYTFSGYKATVVGHSSSIDWASFTSISDKVTYGGKTYTITSIGKSAFNNCTHLALTSLPSGLTSIGNTAFSGCSNLALTSLPDGVTSIGDNAFTNCINFEILILTTAPAIGTSAFSGSGIKEILNLGTLDITTTSYGLNADSVQDYVGALGYVAPTHIQEDSSDSSGLDGVSMAVLKIVPIVLIVCILSVLVMPMIQSKME